MFTEKDYGIPISVELSEAVRRYTNHHDRAEASRLTGIGSSTVRDVVFRNNNLTEDNSKAILVMINTARIHCNLRIAQAVKDSKYFESLK